MGFYLNYLSFTKIKMWKLVVKRRYATTPNDLLNDPNISLKAKGLYGYIQSKPDWWAFSSERITKDTKDWTDSIRAGLIELEEFWYLKREKTKNEKWHWDTDYILYEKPQKKQRSEPSSESPEGGNPERENPTLEKPSYNKEGIKKERYNNKDINKCNTNFCSSWNNLSDQKDKSDYLNIEKEKEKSSAKKEKESYTWHTTIDNLLDEFMVSRKQMKKPMTQLAKDKLIHKIWLMLETYKIKEVEDCISLAIESWRLTIYEPRQTKPKLQYEQPKAREEFTFL